MDVVQRRQADRLAKIAFIVVWLTTTPSITAIAWAITDPLVALSVGLVAGFVLAAVVGLVVLIWPGLRLVWHWAAEITVLVLLLAGYLGLTLWLPWPVALGILTASVGAPFVFPASRRWLLAWIWCGISRHRLRTCFATFIRANRYGSLPWMLLARPTPAGERVWVWLRPGLSLDDLTTEGGLARLAVGCWASEVRITRTKRRDPKKRGNSALIRVDITRRNPLGGTVASPLASLVPDLPDDAAGEATAGLGGLDLPDVPDTEDTPAATNGPKPPPSAASAGAGSSRTTRPKEPAVTTRGGQDLSEWV